MTANIGTPGKNRATEEVDVIDIMLGRMDNPPPTAQDRSQDELMRLAGNGQGAVEICELRPCPLLWCRSATASSLSEFRLCARSGKVWSWRA